MLVQTLHQFSHFADITDEELQGLVAQRKEVSLYSGALLFREGDPAEGVYVLLEGELERGVGCSSKGIVSGDVRESGHVGGRQNGDAHLRASAGHGACAIWRCHCR
jgi:CRP-like cAMP-binding protein